VPVGKLENLVKDSHFTLGLWRIASKPEDVKISLDKVQTPVGVEDSLKIESSGWSKWHLTYGEKLQVEPGETYMLNVRMMPRLESRRGSVVLEPQILDVNGRGIKAIKKKWSGDSGEPFFAEDLGSWRGGIIGAAGKWGWRHISGGFMIPDEGSQMNLALYGSGPGEVWVTEIELRRNFYSVVKTVEPSKTPEYPKAILCKRLKLGEYAGKVLRVGDLNGDGRVEFLFAQRISPKPIKPSSVNYVALRCLTAVDLNGNILWQLGEPDPSGYDVWSDLPVQVFDFNEDGKMEVLCCKDFKIMFLDGATGEVLAETDTPESNPGEGWGEGAEEGFPRILGDSITICSLTGCNPGDFLLKDRYNNLWAYDRKFNRLWSYTGKMAHYAQIYDVDGDGFDEVFSGDALIDQNGEVLWRIDLYGHCDSSIFYRDREGRLILALAYEDGGFYFLDALTGNILREWHLGHGQGVNLASYRPDQPNGLAIAANTFWGGAFWFIFSLEGEVLHADFTDVYGWVPVNWSGDGVELIGSACGLYDGYGRMVVEFPDPHHGKVWVYNICGDKRDEVIVWNDKLLSIYTQDGCFNGIKIFTPKRKLYNRTFYGSFISEPDWTYLKQ
jgi:hypothetical protein